jgi:hypothetical protein
LLALIFEPETMNAGKASVQSIELSNTPSTILARAAQPEALPTKMAACPSKSDLLILSLEQISRPVPNHIVQTNSVDEHLNAQPADWIRTGENENTGAFLGVFL